MRSGVSKSAAALIALLALIAGGAIGWFAHSGWLSSQLAAYTQPLPAASHIPLVIVSPSINRNRGVGRSETPPKYQVTPAPSPEPTAPILAPDAPPKIISVSLSSPVAIGGQVVTGYVQTSSNVASVEARIAGYSQSLAKVGVGRFTLSYQVPNLPAFLHRTYAIQVIARNTRGDAVTGTIPITVR